MAVIDLRRETPDYSKHIVDAINSMAKIKQEQISIEKAMMLDKIERGRNLETRRLEKEQDLEYQNKGTENWWQGGQPTPTPTPTPAPIASPTPQPEPTMTPTPTRSAPDLMKSLFPLTMGGGKDQQVSTPQPTQSMSQPQPTDSSATRTRATYGT